MSLRSLFAQNLRQLSATKKSHAHVARALDINRQQFNNYITGKNLPNETVVAKICKYFKVTEAYMFRDVSENAASSAIDMLSQKQRYLISKFIKSQKAISKKAFLDGLYYIYFSNYDVDGSIICSLLAIRQDLGIYTFRRVTRKRNKFGFMGVGLRGFHYGITWVSQNKLFMLGVDRFEENAVTLLTGTPVVSTKILYSGIATVSTGVEFRNVPFVICAAKGVRGVRDALRSANVYPANSPLLDDSISQFFENSENKNRKV
jgi:transcriptional regulator with XRE-family HTH domain